MWSFSGITFTAEYLVMNTMADLESREDKHLSKWKLNHQLFQKTCQAFWKTRD